MDKSKQKYFRVTQNGQMLTKILDNNKKLAKANKHNLKLLESGQR